MTQTFAATVAALIAPLSEALAKIEAAHAEAQAYISHPLYAGACAEIAKAAEECAVVEQSLGFALAALDNLQSRLVAGDPPRENVGTAGDEAREAPAE